ncbi:MAG: single-stranded DNA-binding protein [Bacilli bacterium]|nr:single-stranded DNA-binding protein [Bacilli bacterium]
MINMVMLVGRLVQDPEIVERDNGNKVSRVTLAVNRKFKSSDGVYHTDFIDCVFWNSFAKNLTEYCSKGDLIGIRGRLQVDTYEKDGVKRKITDVIAESITFLSSGKTKQETIEI